MRLRLLSIGLFALALALYLPFLSGGLDDFDSFSFVMAMRQFDLVLQQPHPPGFPFYIGMANALNLFINDPQRTLVLLSAVWGALGVVALLHVGRALFDERVGVAAALLLMLTPSWWIHSSLALSDVAGLALPLGAMGVVLNAYSTVSPPPQTPAPNARASREGGASAALPSLPSRGRVGDGGLQKATDVGVAFIRPMPKAIKKILDIGRNECRPYNNGIWLFGWMLAGLSLGLRPHNALLIVVLGLLALWRVRHAWKRAVMLALVGGVVGCLVWFVPLMVATGGLTAYLDAIGRHSQHVLGSDSLFNDTLVQRLAEFGQGLGEVFGGAAGVVGVGGVIAIILCVFPHPKPQLPALVPRPREGLLAPFPPRHAVREAPEGWEGLGMGGAFVLAICILWLVLVTGKLFLIESLERPRLYLPMLPPLYLLLVAGWNQLKWRWVMPLLVAGMCAVFLWVSVPLVNTLHTQRSAPEQAAAFIREQFAPQETVVVSLGSYRAAQNLLGYYLLEYSPSFGAGGWRQAWDEGRVNTIVLMDRDDLPTAIPDELESMGLVTLADRTFERDRAVFPQHVTVRVQVLVAAESLSAADLALPTDRQIVIAESDAAKFLGEGWYRAEDIGGVAARWTEQNATLRIALPDDISTLVLVGTPFPEGQQVQVWVNGNNAGTFDLTGASSEVRVPLDSAWLSAEIDTIELRHTLVASPTGDTRSLAAAYASVKVE